MTKDKQKADEPLNPFVPLILTVLAYAIVLYFVIPEVYDREAVDGATQVLTDSYHVTERTSVSLFNIFRPISEGPTVSANMVPCVMLIGGIMEIYKRISTVGAVINSVLEASERMSSRAVIAIVMIVFFIFGGTLGWSEHTIPFVPVIVSLAPSPGYNSLIGMAVSGFACLINFAVAPFNVCTVGTPHTITELPMFSGWKLGIVALVCVWILSSVWAMRYAKEVKADPSRSLVKDVDTSSLRISVGPGLKFDLPKEVSVISLTISILVTIYGILSPNWSYTETTAIFMIGGIVPTAINRMNLDDGINMVLDGVRGAFSDALVVDMARAVQWTMTSDGLVDPLVYGLSNLMHSASAYMSTVGMFIVNFFVNALIPSDSGQATVVMPVMIPLADMLHIARRTAILAFQFDDGIFNTFQFTNETPLIYLSLDKMPLKSWYKSVLSLHGSFPVLQLIFLFVTVQISYGPF